MKPLKRQRVRSPRKATTFRLEPGVQEGLALIAKVLRVPLNRLVNEAVEGFVRKRTAEVVMKMEETLKLLKAGRAEDPGFEHAIAAFADSEGSNARGDPAEGEVERRRGPVQARVHKLLNGELGRR